ncbi:MAG: FTR1 family protein [Pseudomonadota bacterium]
MSFLNVFMVVSRETLEIISFLFLICNALISIKNHKRYVFYGVIFGIVQALLIFFFMNTMLVKFFESYDIIITFISGLTMLYTAFWICNQLRYINRSLLPYQTLGENTEEKYYKYYIIVFTGMAIMREVMEILIFTSGVMSIYNLDRYVVFLYGIIAMLVNIVIGIMGYVLLIRKIIKLIFKISYYWMVCFAAHLIATGFVKLNSVGAINILNFQIWDLSHVIANNSFLGNILHMLLGYNAMPSALEVVVYISVLIITYINTTTCIDKSNCNVKSCLKFKK